MKHNIIVIVAICSFVIGMTMESFRLYIKKNKGKKYNKFCPKNCQYLNPTEAEQTDEKEAHYCDKYSKRLFHRGNHPKIVKCKECRKEIRKVRAKSISKISRREARKAVRK